MKQIYFNLKMKMKTCKSKMPKFFIMVLGIFTTGLYSANAQTIYVNSSTGNDTSGDGSSGSPYKTFTKGYTAVSDGETLDLTGTFTWTDADETGDGTYGFTINKNITIQGPENNLAVIRPATSLTQEKRIFEISDGYTVILRNLELYYGYPSTSSYAGDGGAIYSGASTDLTIINCYIHDNNARQGAGLNIFGELTMENSTLSDNEATSNSGGINITPVSGTIEITNSTIFNNSSGNYGGGFYFVDSNIEVIVTNCTIANNSADNAGGGISVELGTLIIKNTIVANNTDGSTGGDIDHFGGTITDNGYNIVEITNSSSLTGTGTTTGEQSSLNLSSALADNSTINSTPTLALSSGSVAINAGNSSANGSVSVPTTDQRGASRNGITDIGAYEFGGTFPVAAPTTQASSVSFSSTSATATTVSWTRGDGDNCAVFMAIASSGTAAPADGTAYVASTNFGLGSQIGTSGWYCIYTGTGTQATIAGVSPSTTYRVHVCEYNGTSGSELYLTGTGTDNPGNVTTDDAPEGAPQITGITYPLSANGVYTQNGDLNGKQSWTNGIYYVYWDSGYWAIDVNTSVGDNAEFYIVNSDDVPPSSGYTSSTGSGTPVLSGFTVNTAPTVTTQAVSDITTTTATGNGNITDLGTPNPTAYGVCYNTTGTPTISDDIIDNGAASSTGAFMASLSGLTPNTIYYVRAYATNAAGTVYGDQVSFTTLNVGDIVYVNSSTGNDTSGDGSSGNPYKTFTKGYTEVNDGGIIDLTGTFTWTDADETGDVATNGYTLGKNLTIQGQGAGSTIIQADATAGTADRRVFTINGSYTVNINDVTLRYGYLSTNGRGGAVYVGTITTDVTIDGCILESNEASAGSYTYSYGGGALCYYNTSASGGDLIITNSIIRNNTSANCWGGAIYSYRNTTGTGAVVIENTTINGNTAANGTAISGYYGAFIITNSTITGNYSSYCMIMSNHGYGVFYMTNVTFAYNDLGSSARGLYLEDVADIRIKNSILAQNKRTDNTTYDYYRTSGTLNESTNNLIEVQGVSDFTNGVNGNIIGEQSCLGLSSTLELNGSSGIVPTLALSETSIAANAGTTSANGSVAIPTLDQRGIARYGLTDIGAYELQTATINPEINITGNGNAINNEATTTSESNNTDFGSVTVEGDGEIVKTFTISNIGDGDLNLTGTSPYVTISGTNASDFSITTIPSSSIAAGNSTTFSVTFNPSDTGARIATLSIENNDCDEDLYTFNIQGTGIDINTAPTASDFSTSSGPYQNQVYTLSTSDFGYSDADSDPLDHVRVTAIPSYGILYIDADSGDDYDSGEELSNGATVSKANLDAGNLQYYTTSYSGTTTFTFDVNDGTDYSSSTYTATLNVVGFPVLTTSAATSVTSTSATLGGNVTSGGGSTVTERGVVYSLTNTSPEIGGSGVTQDVNDSGSDTFSESIGSLSSDTKYYVQAYATNAAGTSYGGVENFTTNDLPVAICKDTVVYLDGTGSVIIDATFIDNGSSAEAGIKTMTLNDYDFNCSDQGDNIVTLTIVDNNDNEAQCDATVTVRSVPTITLVDDIEVQLEPGECETEVDYPEIIATDNCGSNVTLKLLSGLGSDGIFPIGKTTEVWIGTDDSGNSDLISFSVVVTATNSLPTIDELEDIILYSNTSGLVVPLTGISGGIDCDPQDIVINAFADNTELVASLAINYTEGSTGELELTIASGVIGTAEITVTVEDSDGATTERTFNLTIDTVNDPPFVVNPIADLTVNASYVLKVPISSKMGELFDDTDDNSLTIAVMEEGTTALPSWATYSGDTLFCTPAIEDVGCVNIVVQATDAEGAIAADTFQVCVEGYPTNVGDLGAGVFEVHIYPNPTKGKVNLNINSSEVQDVELSVMDITGRVVMRQKYSALQTIQFDMSGNVSGMYFVQMNIDGNQVVKKLLVDHK